MYKYIYMHNTPDFVDDTRNATAEEEGFQGRHFQKKNSVYTALLKCCNTHDVIMLQHTATHCNTLQHTATHMM